MNNNNDSNKEILLFSLPEEVGALAQALAIFKVFIIYVMITLDYSLNLGSQRITK